MRSLLFIAYMYPPFANSGTRRSLEFANHLPDHGWRPTVLTLTEPKPRDRDDRLLDEVRAGTRVLRAGHASERWARRLSAPVPTQYRERVAQGLAWRLERMWGAVPDDAASWRGEAVAAALRAHRETPFDAILATGSPWTSLLVARDVAERTGLPYVLDYRDQWRPSGTVAWDTESRLQRWFSPRLEKRAAAQAAAVVTVTPTLATALTKDTGRDDIECITNGFEPKDFANLPPAPRDGLVRVSYTGVWRPGYGPDLLYLAVQRLKEAGVPGLERLRVDTAGFEPGPAAKHGVQDLIREHGRVPHSTALRLMTDSDMVFLPVSQGFYALTSLPGKLFEYLGSGRPILAATLPDSEVARVIGDAGGGRQIMPDDVESATAVLADLCAGRSLTGFSAQRPERLASYTRASTAKQLAGILDRVTRR
ncbi:glycosyltransferase [Roseateles violae]|uniref:Glycosyltransferase n=1 Tax=Roseateles violae TaxID=3058042 RepID=A0ABT8DTV4_9BURK|nr:glycosyltransferase [Pelomonas sp. PFR6]MDN3920460.1 glycosyltransferase [Pelomonas sp. PFR6]